MTTEQVVPVSRGNRRWRVAVLAGLVVAGVAAVLIGSRWGEQRLYGPLLQQPSPRAMTVVWRTRGLPASDLRLVPAVPGATVQVTRTGLDYAARIEGLQPGTTHGYEVRAGARRLAAARFTTARPEGPFRFLAFGDSGKDNHAQYALARRMQQEPLDFVVHTGDLIYETTRDPWFRCFYHPYRDVLARAPFWPCLGNHDEDEPEQADSWHEAFRVDANGPASLSHDAAYYFDYGNARFAVYDSGLGRAAIERDIYPWLERIMAERPVTWRFVVAHFPVLTSDGPRKQVNQETWLMPEYEQLKIDVVFSGHDHKYLRTVPVSQTASGPQRSETGVTYVITGAGGGRLYPAAASADRPAWIAACNDHEYSYTRVAIDGARLTLEQVDEQGRVIDRWEHSKSGTRMAEASQP